MKDAIDLAFAISAVLAAALASGHAIIYKRDSRSAAIWVLVVWLLPAVGALAYAVLGVNRVQRRAVRMRSRMVRHLLPGNSIEPLVDGPNAYPAMLQAINAAKSSIAMASYIFDGDGVGADFVDALAAATQRGVEVRVLIDDVDARFSSSTAVKPL